MVFLGCREDEYVYIWRFRESGGFVVVVRFVVVLVRRLGVRF